MAEWMNSIFSLFFWGSILSICYAYVGYPISLFIIGTFRKRVVVKRAIYPSATIIITVFNEERRIAEKIDNTLSLQYPIEKLQIIIASDGSTDCTNDIVAGYASRGVELLRVTERKGKENAQKEAIQMARGEIIVFSDVATILDQDGLKEIVSNFADHSVGCVSSEDRLIGRDGIPCGEGFYVQYEMRLRNIESRVFSVVGVSGSFFAARREVCRDFSGEMQSDFRTVLNAIKLGYRGVSDPRAVGYYQDILDEKKEFDRKVRTVVRGLTVFFHHLEYLNGFKYGIFAYQYFCHKLLRWLVPFFLMILFLSNLVLAIHYYWYSIILIGQMIFYGVALYVKINGLVIQNALVKMPVYFIVVNLSIFVAWLQYWSGRRVVMWQPSER